MNSPMKHPLRTLLYGLFLEPIFNVWERLRIAFDVCESRVIRQLCLYLYENHSLACLTFRKETITIEREISSSSSLSGLLN